MITFIKNYHTPIVSEDLYFYKPLIDLELINDADTEADIDIDVFIKNEIRWCGEQEPILIKDLYEYLNEAELGGASHIEIFFHTDHREYEFYPCSFAPETEEQCEQRQEDAIREKEETKKALMESIDNHINSIGMSNEDFLNICNTYFKNDG